MTYQATPLFERDSAYKLSGPTIFILSVVLHIVTIIILPVLSSIFHSSNKFDRPKTFQLVSSPLKPAPTKRVTPVENAIKQRKPQEKQKAAPRQTPDSQAPKQRRKAQKEQNAARPYRENIDELSSILDEIPAPARISSSSSNRNHRYFSLVRDKIQRYWKPTRENRSINVVVSFSINKDGSITSPSISASSGDHALDNLALRAVKLAAPFGRLPLSFKEDRVDVNLTLIPTRK